MHSSIAAAVLAATLAFAGLAGLGGTGGLGGPSAASADVDARPGHDAASGPSVVEVPLEESLEVRAAAGWSFADCSVLLAASPLVTACTAEAFTVVGPAYDADILPARVSVPLRSGSLTMTVDYVIRLAKPTPPSAPDTTLGLPLRAGAVSLIPLSELGIECGLCSAGVATIEVGAVAPTTLGAARVTGTHLVFSAAAGAQGRVEIDLRVRDDVGTASNTFKVMLDISDTSGAPLHGLHLALDAEAGGQTVVDLTAAALVAWPSTRQTAANPGTAATGLVVSDCGPALHGSVRCSPGGEIHYEPSHGTREGTSAPATLADQFSVRLIAPDGRQTIASVTIGASPAGAVLVPAVGAKHAKLELPLPRPPMKTEEDAGGATTSFSELMNAVGAR